MSAISFILIGLAYVCCYTPIRRKENHPTVATQNESRPLALRIFHSFYEQKALGMAVPGPPVVSVFSPLRPGKGGWSLASQRWLEVNDLGRLVGMSFAHLPVSKCSLSLKAHSSMPLAPGSLP